MENKKIIIPIVLGAVLLLGIVFTVVYKSTSEDPFEKPAVETLAPKETKKNVEKELETQVSVDQSNNLKDFEVNEAIKQTEVQIKIKEEDMMEDYEAYEESMVIENEESSTEETYSLSEEQEITATSEVSAEINQGVEDGVREYTRKQAEDWFQEVLDANGGEIPWEK